MSGSAARTGRAGDRRDPRRGQGKGGRTRRRRRDGVRHRPQHAGVASRLNRPETIEDTAELVTKAGGQGIAVRCDHLVPSEVEALAQRIEHEQHGRLDVLVDDTWGGDQWIEWRPIWEHDLDKGLRALRNGLETHLITLHTMLPLLVQRGRGLVVEVTDGDDTFNERYRGSMFFDMIKVAITRLGRMLSEELRPHGVTSVSLTPGFLRSEEMLEHFGVTEENWRDGIAKDKWFAISETPRYIGRAVVALASDPDVSRWAGKALSSGVLAKHYGFTDVDGSQPEASRFFADAYFGGDQDANVEDYRSTTHSPGGDTLARAEGGNLADPAP